MGEMGWGVSAAGSGPQAAVAEGELWFVFVVLMIIQVNDVIFTFGASKHSTALEIWLDQRVYLIYKADRKTIAL